MILGNKNLLNNIPKDWRKVLLGENAYIKGRIGWKGLKQSEYVEEGAFLVAGKHIKNGVINWDSCDKITEQRYQESIEIALQNGDIIFSKDGSLGNPSLIQNLDFKATINSTMMLVRVKDCLIPRYVYQIFRSVFFTNLIKERKSGSSIPHIFQRDMQAFYLPLPPIQEQQKIADILSTVDAKIEVIDQQITETQELKKGLMQRLLTKGICHTEFKDSPLGEIPVGWEVVKIEEIADVKGGKRLPKGQSLSEQRTSHPYIRVADMFMGGVSLDKILFVPEDIFPIIKNYTILKDDLFISVAGTLGVVGEIPSELDGANLTENANKLTNIQINKSFLLQILLSPIIQNVIDREKTNNAQPKLALTRIRTFQIPKPPIQEQQKIADILTSVDDKIEVLSEKKTTYQELKKGLMQQLLTGKVRVRV